MTHFSRFHQKSTRFRPISEYGDLASKAPNLVQARSPKSRFFTKITFFDVFTDFRVLTFFVNDHGFLRVFRVFY